MSFRLKIAERILPSSGADIRSDVNVKHLLCSVLRKVLKALNSVIGVAHRSSRVKNSESSMLTFDDEYRHAT